VYMNVPEIAEELLNVLHLMFGELVCDEADLWPARLAYGGVRQEGNEFLAGAAGGGGSDHLSSLGVERRIGRQCPVAVVLPILSKVAKCKEALDRLQWLLGEGSTGL